MRKISEISGVSVDHIPEAAFVPKKRFFMADRGFGRTVFSSGDAVIIIVYEEEYVVKLGCFMPVQGLMDNELSSVILLSRGFCYSTIIGENGLAAGDFWSEFIKVWNREIPNPAFFNADKTLRKAMVMTYTLFIKDLSRVRENEA